MPRKGSRSHGRRGPAAAFCAAAIAVAVLGAVSSAPPAKAQEQTVGPSDQPYEDQYLLEGDVPVYDLGVPLTVEPLGYRRLAAELVYYDGDHDTFGDEVERGGRTSWRQETLNWGTLEAQAQFVDFDSSYLGRAATGSEGLVTFRQSAMAVSDIAVLDTAVGHQRTVLDSLLHGGYRYRLPTTPLLGASVELARPEGDLRLTTGKVGVYRGIALPRFEETGGKLTTIAYHRHVNEQLEFGGELANLRDDDDIRDHTSMLLGARYAPPWSAHEHSARLLADGDGSLGFWTDSVTELGTNPVLRYGMFYFDAELAWTDVPIANDQMGLYLRADISKYRYSLSAGYDYTETGLDAIELAPSKTNTIYVSSNLRVARRLSLGFNGDVSTRSFTGTFSDEQFVWRGNAYVLLGLWLGDMRIEAFGDEVDSDAPGNRRQRNGFRAAFDWRMHQRVRLTTELRTQRYDELRGDVNRDELSVLFRYDLLDNLSLGLNTALYRARSDAFPADDGVGINADVRWAFRPSWYASLSLNHNRAALDTLDPDLSAYSDLRDSTVWLTVGYARSAGQPYPMFGRAHDGKAGTGGLSGEVFFDENRDSIRQPSERVAAGATVLLDGRYETRTDEQGRYAFAPVPTGTHEVTLLTEELPLPWGLDDERPRSVTVWFRQTADLDFPLVVMN
jgi:hypothetical protein